MEVGADVGISYHIDATKVSLIFQKYRKGIDEITDIFMRNMVRDAFVKSASTMKVDDVYGVGKVALITSVENMVRSQVEDIVVEKIYFIGSLRLPASVTTALDAKIGATQKAQQRINEVAQAAAEADKVREVAKGQADAIRERANAEAEKITLIGNALQKNPGVVRLMAIEKWNGVLPRVTGESDLLLMLDNQTKK